MDHDEMREKFEALQRLHASFAGVGDQHGMYHDLGKVIETMPRLAERLGEGEQASASDLLPLLLAVRGVDTLREMLLTMVAILRPDMETIAVQDRRGLPWGIVPSPARGTLAVVMTEGRMEAVALLKSIHDMGDGVVGVLDRCEDEPPFMHFFTGSLRDDRAAANFDDPHGFLAIQNDESADDEGQ